jgi:hypothetical protein
MTTRPIAARLAVYLLLTAEDVGNADHAREILDMAETIVARLSPAEFQQYADEYDDSRVRFELSRAVSAPYAN